MKICSKSLAFPLVFALSYGLLAVGNDLPSADRSVPVDRLLGRTGRQEHAHRIAKLTIDGKTYPWESFAKWGEELATTGQVASPPTGPAPSKPLSEHYRCIDCHNLRPEDPIAGLQDPQARAEWIASQTPGANETRLFLAPGTTLWGAVNRDSFYNDSYEIYHGLLTSGLRTMNPTSLEDATQVCCKYCSVGRFAKNWEIASLLTYFWDLEVRLSDLGLPPSVEREVLNVLAEPEKSEPEDVTRMRRFLQRHYLTRAGDTAIPPPSFDEDGNLGPYPDKLMFEGDPKIGAQLFGMACAQCHGAGKVYEVTGADLVADLPRFFDVLAHGTEQAKQPYMPMFTSQRLSRQQIADIQAYLEEQ